MHAEAIDKVYTGISGLDDILKGGLPRNRVTLITGGPGSGKTVFGLEFLYRGALNGEAGILVTFEERANALRNNAHSLGWDIDSLEQNGKLFFLDAEVDPGAIISGDFSLNGLLGILAGKAEEMSATRVVIDSVDVLLRLFNNPKRESDELYLLNSWLLDHNFTTLLSAKKIGENERAPYNFLDFIVDCVLFLDHRVVFQISTRRLRVIKYRGSGFGKNEYPFIIRKGGIAIMPITQTELHFVSSESLLSTGASDFDEILGGGIRKGASVLISGLSGTGKTTFASSITKNAASRGDKVLFINYEESEQTMLSSMLSPGIDLKPELENKKLLIKAYMPESMGMEEHLLNIFEAIDFFEPEYLVIDAISAVNRMGTEGSQFNFLIRLVNRCKSLGISTIFTNQTRGESGFYSTTATGLSSIFDTVVILIYKEENEVIGRKVLIFKSRGVKHSNAYHSFTITDKGIVIDGKH